MELSTPSRIGDALSESRIVRYARPYCWFSDSPLALSGGRRDHARAMLYASKSSPLFPPNGRFQENRQPSRVGRVRWTALSVCGVGMVRCGYPRQAWRGQTALFGSYSMPTATRQWCEHRESVSDSPANIAKETEETRRALRATPTAPDWSA